MFFSTLSKKENKIEKKGSLPVPGTPQDRISGLFFWGSHKQEIMLDLL
jgi:hypothetical protein